MNSEINAQKMVAIFRKLSEGIKEVENTKNRFQNTERLDSLFKGGLVVCSIFNHITIQFDYISSNVKQMLGCSAEHLMSLSFQDFLIRYIHPEDLQVLSTQLLPDLVRYASNSAVDIDNFSVQYNYRMQNTLGNWIEVEQQSSPIKSDRKGNVLLDVNFYTLAGNANYENANLITISIFVRDADGINKLEHSKSYLAKNINESNFTLREIEILKMLARGKTSKEIGEILYISESTVNTHRKNMLEKFDLKNTSELVAHAFKSGII